MGRKPAIPRVQASKQWQWTVAAIVTAMAGYFLVYSAIHDSRETAPTLAIPSLGLGTWKAATGEVGDAVSVALHLRGGDGWMYKHLDLASRYLNLEEIGSTLSAIFSSTRRREEVFITSKIWNTNHRPNDVMSETKHTLSLLQLEYLDLMLIHWPVAMQRRKTPSKSGVVSKTVCDFSTVAWVCDGDVQDEGVTLEQTWQAMESLVDAGLVRHVGVSNFNTAHLERILKVARITPAVNQVEMHPYLPQHELLEFCKSKGIRVVAYSPIGSPKNAALRLDQVAAPPLLIEHPDVLAVAVEVSRTPAQVLLRWNLQRGVVVIPKSTNSRRIKENAMLYDFRLTDEHITRLNRVRDVAGNDGRDVRYVKGNPKYLKPGEDFETFWRGSLPTSQRDVAA